ncbi:MAG: SDR family oxidoreductase [Alphaproteobacteria bacterium]|nr:SDR family oxidoreductase [Alphaproteobacteria bacterium]
MIHTAKTALITGAAKRVGRAIALHLAAQGWNIALHYHRSRSDAERTAAEIAALGRKAALIEADLADADAVARIFPAAQNALGTVSLLINNASVFGRDALANFTRDSWGAHMDINLYAPLLLSRDFAAAWKDIGQTGGNIIHLTDGCEGWSLSPNFLTYTLSKAGLAALVPLLAQELAPAIRVNAIAPGFTLPSPFEDQAAFEKLAGHAPLKCLSSPEEVCGAVDFIINSQSVTGQTLALNGGLHL